VVQPWARRTSTNMLLEGAMKYQQVDPVMRARLQKEWNHTPSWPPLVLAFFVAGALGYAIWFNRHRNV
jgi:hypothetical protein